MLFLIKPSFVAGNITVPGSKSHTIRAIVAAMLADGVSVIHAPLNSADTHSTLNAAIQLGARCRILPDGDWEITGNGGILKNTNDIIDLGNSGTGLCFLTAAASIADFAAAFDGDESLRSRPMEPLLSALAELGVRNVSTNGCCPLKVRGPLAGGHAQVGGSSSQYLSALLFAAALAQNDTVLDLDFLNEAPYAAMTLDWMEYLGLKVQYSPDLLHFEIPGQQRIKGFTRLIPADFSTALFPLAAAAVAGRGVSISNLDFNDVQGDKKAFMLLEQMGLKIEYGNELFVPAIQAKLHGGEFDLNSMPDALPALSAVAATLEGECTRLVNVPQARTKETDRIACMSTELRKMGAEIEELADGMVIYGRKLHGAPLKSYGDHRIAMALSIAALAADSESVLEGIECAAVTYPDFVRDFQALGADFHLAGE